MTLVQRLVILVILALAPVLGGVAYYVAQLRDIRDQEIRADAERLVRQLDAQHRQLQDTIGHILNAVAVAAPLAVERTESCANLRASFASPNNTWLDLMVLDAAGTVRCTTMAGTLGADRAGVPEVEQARAPGNLILGPLTRPAFQDLASLPAALAWSGPDGARGVVLATIRPYVFLAPLIADLRPPGARIFIADRAGHVVHAIPPVDAAGLPPALATALRRTEAGSSIRTPWPDDADHLIATIAASAKLAAGSLILVALPREAAMHDLTATTRLISWGLSLTLLVTTLIAYWGGLGYIRRPLGVLTTAALRWRDGDQSARVRLPGRSEIAALGRVFDEMADATEQGERQIREAADLLNALIESSADAIFVKDREGRYMLANSTFARVLGQDRAALVGNRDTELMSPERCAEIRDIHADILASARPYVGDLTVPAYDTAHIGPRILQTIYAPIRAPAGAVIAVAGISRDVTDERRAAADLRLAKERAEAADESKTRFLAAASHDLRQPVQAAILFAGLIHAHATGDLQKPAEQLRLVLNDLRSMLDSLFDVSRYDTQSMRAEIVAFPLQPLIDQTIAALAGQAGAKGLVIGAQPSGIWVRSDHALLGRMLGNIVQNAVRYTALGSIRIDVSIVQDIDVSIVQDSVHIAVTDTGPGIAQADMARIWQEFEQLHNQGRDRRQGLGLGLAIVRRLSRILGHHVAVTSQPGQGTTFTITLPRAEPVTIPPAGVPSHGAHMAQARSVIVVEDDPALLTVLDMLLQDNGWHVIAAASTADALSLLNTAQHAPDVILTDYRLQGGALGTAAITAIRARFGRAIPAIILTGDVGNGTKGTDDPLADSYGLGDVSVLRKPIAAAELAAAMHRAMAVDAAP